MINDKLKTLLITLQDKTNNGSIKWEQSGSPQVYYYTFKTGILSIEKSEELFSPGQFEYIIEISDNQNIKLESITVSRSEHDYSFVVKLFDDIRRNALNINKQIDDFLNELG